jgi:hypothetical protein
MSDSQIDKTENIMSRRAKCVAEVVVTFGLLIVSLTVFAGELSTERCSVATLRGHYVFKGEGQDNAGNLRIHAGSEIYNGDNTMSGVLSGSTEGAITSFVDYTGTYTANPDRSGTLTIPSGGAEIPFDQFTGPSGQAFTWVETDAGLTFGGSEWRVDQPGFPF